LLAPPKADHAIKLCANQSVSGRMILTQRAPTAMNQGNSRSARGRCELNLDFRGLVWAEISIAPGRHWTSGRLPYLDRSDLYDMCFAIALEGFEDTAADARLYTNEASACAGVAELRPAAPPAIDFGGEDFEGSGRSYRDGDRDASLISTHGRRPRDPRVRSACALKARSRSCHRFSTSSSHARRRSKADGLRL
jgi:hypothetical protein